MQSEELRRVLGSNIRRRRLELGLTQEQLAERLNVTQGYISDLEKGKRAPLLKTLAEFSEILQVSPSTLLAPISAAVA